MFSFRATYLATLLMVLGGTSHGMDLQQAFENALEQDSTIRAARAALSSGLERLPQAKSQLLPTIQANVSRNFSNTDITSPNSLGVDTTTNTIFASLGKTVALRQPLINPQRYFQYEQAKDLVLDAKATYQRSLQELVIRVSSAYMDTLLAKDQLALVRAQKQYYSTMMDAARMALRAGSGTRTDIDDAQARFDMTLAWELEAQQNVNYTRQTLELMINQSAGDLSGLNIEHFASLPRELLPLEEWLALAQANSPEIHSLIARRGAADKEVSKAKSGHSPTLDGVLQWSDSSNENITRLNSRFVTSSAGVQLVIPLYQGGYVNSVVRQALAERYRVEETLEATRRDLRLRVHKEYRGVTEGAMKISALEQAVRSAEQLVVSTGNSSRAGVRTVLDVLMAQQQLAMAKRDLAQSRYAYLMSRLRLNVLAGKDIHAAIQDILVAFKP